MVQPPNFGGAIYNFGTLNVFNTTFSGNTAPYGGAIYNNGGTVRITNSTFSGNSAGSGGAIRNDSGITTVINSTFSGNGGSAIANQDRMTLTNTIVANSGGPNCFGTIVVDGGHNLRWPSTDGSCVGIFGDPKLAGLSDNGGATQTLALQTGSAAIDAGDDVVCAASPVNNLDQRGVNRPQGAHCDIGAFELEIPPTPTPTPSPSPTPTPTPTETPTPTPSPSPTPTPVNTPPQLSQIANANINEGGTYSTSGSFTDIDSTSWTATVDYGDESGTQPLSLSGQNFTLSHAYTTSGTYITTVIITDNQGASSTQTSTITVNNVAPSVGAINAPTSPVEPNTPVSINVNFTDPGTNDTHTATIDWGDRTTGSGTVTEINGSGSVTGTHTYIAPGTYTVIVTVTDKNGSSSQSTTQVFVNAPPVLSPLSSANINAGDTYSNLDSFTDPDSTSWTATVDYGDGSGVHTLALNSDKTFALSHQYTTAGTFAVTVKITDNERATGTATATVVVNALPTAHAGGPYIVNEGSDITLVGTGSDTDGDTLTYAWDLTGGTSFTTLGQSVIFDGVAPETKTVVLQVCDPFGACTRDTATVTITNVLPTVNAIAIAPAQPQQNAVITASANFTDPGILDIHTASWNWGDGNTTTGTVTESSGSGSVSNTHTYTTYGTYTITLTVTDKDGGVGSTNTQIFVNAPPVGNTGGPYSVTEGGLVTLEATATDPDGDTLTYAWDLDNSGNYETSGQNVVFSAAGLNSPSTKTVSLKVCDTRGACNTSQTTVAVTEASPIVGTISAPATTKINTATSINASFTDPGTLDTHTVSINWGDGNTTTGTVTESNGSGTVTGTHTYTTLDSYTITLTVTDETGANGSSIFVIAVIPSNGLKGSNLSHTNYSGANLSSQDLTGANLSVAAFNNTDFQDANLTQINGSNSSFIQANFTGANLYKANMSNSNLTNANFTGANLQSSNFSGTTISGVIWSNTICPNGTNSNNDGGTCKGQGGGL